MHANIVQQMSVSGIADRVLLMNTRKAAKERNIVNRGAGGTHALDCGRQYRNGTSGTPQTVAAMSERHARAHKRKTEQTHR